MRIITTSRIVEFYTKHADAKLPLEVWVSRIKALKINNLNELKQVANSVDVIGNNRVIFDIKGNKYRLIVSIDYEGQLIYIKYILTHAEYDKDNWKNDPYF